MPRRAQTALEYLMTYGWALLIIAIVAIALWKLGVFSPAAREGVSRQPDPFFIDYRTIALDAANDQLKFTLANGAGATVKIYDVKVYEGGKDVTEAVASPTLPRDIEVNGQEQFTINLTEDYVAGDVHSFRVEIVWEYYGSGVNRTSVAYLTVRAA